MSATIPRKPPAWLEQMKQRMTLIKLLDMAFDETVSDADVRRALQDIAEEFGNIFAKTQGIG